jgi:hypothetical protein
MLSAYLNTQIGKTDVCCSFLSAVTFLHFSDGVTSNLIDLNCEVVLPPMPLPRREHDYVNDIVGNSSRDVFDMREYHHAPFETFAGSLVARADSFILVFQSHSVVLCQLRFWLLHPKGCNCNEKFGFTAL